MERKIKKWADKLYIEPQNEVWDDIRQRMSVQPEKKPKTRQIGLMIFAAASFSLIIVSFVAMLWPNSPAQSILGFTIRHDVKPSQFEVLDPRDASIYVSQTQIRDLSQAYSRLRN